MSGYLLDTNVLSEILRKKPDAKVMARLRATPHTALHTAAICVMELRFGAARHPSAKTLWGRIERELLSRVKILALGQAEAIAAGDILAGLAARAEPIGVEDVLLAATARAQDLVVVTRNVRHLGRVSGIEVESWWD